MILADQDTVTSTINAATVPNKPTGNADYVKEGTDAGDYYTSIGSTDPSYTGDQTFDADQWGATRVVVPSTDPAYAGPVSAAVKWGDNLLGTHLNTGKPIRVEVNLFADEATTTAVSAAFSTTMQGYPMVSLEGSQKSELFGTLGTATAMTPLVYTPKATISILKYDDAKKWYSTVVQAPITMSGEVNASGNLIYGFNWGSSSGLSNPDVGNYRLVFTVADDSIVTFSSVVAGTETTEGAASVPTPMLSGTKVSYLDVAIGQPLLQPALPYAQATPTPTPTPTPSPVVPASTVAKSDFNGDGHPDLLARDSLGNLWLYPGSGKSSWLTKVKVGIGWSSMTALVAPGDFNGDGHSDLLARDSLGNLWLYPGSGKSSWLTKVKVGIGWSSMTALVAPGDFNGDGHPDLLARDSLGNLWLYPGSGKASWLTKAKVGTGWNSMNALIGVGDFTGDNHVDLLARDGLGNLWLYPGNGAGGWMAKAKVGNGWNGMTALVGPRDFSGDGHVDVIARNSLGQLLLYKGSGVASWLPPAQQIGIGWNGMTALVS